MKKILNLLLTLGLACIATAGEIRDHGHSHAEIKIPSTLPEIRAEIAAQQKALAAALASRDATAAHAAADVLAAAVRAIPRTLPSAEKATLQRVSGMANNAANAWGDAGHAAADGEFEKAGRASARADAAYRLIDARLQSE